MKNDPVTHIDIFLFIQEYEEGKYGYAVRGDDKALMYYMATKCVHEGQLDCLHYHFEKHFMGLGDWRDDDPATDNAWVAQDGTIYYTQFGYHLFVAENCLLTPEAEFEKTHAKVRFDSMTMSDCTEYMTETPSNEMKRALKVFGLKRR